MPEITLPDAARLHWKDWGDGPPVVLLAGWPFSADCWDELAVTLVGAGLRTLALDRRGFGRSSQPWQGHDYDGLADDLAAVIRETGLRDATLVGFSMGGGEVARYLSRHGGRGVAKVALLASVVPGRAPGDPAGLARYEKLAQQLQADRSAFFSGFFKDFFGVGPGTNGNAPVSAERLEWARQQAMQASLRSTLACAHAFCTTDFRPDLPAFRMPTLIVHGTADATVPIAGSAREAHAGIRNSVLLEYEEAPHGLFVTHQRRLATDLLRFLHD